MHAANLARIIIRNILFSILKMCLRFGKNIEISYQPRLSNQYNFDNAKYIYSYMLNILSIHNTVYAWDQCYWHDRLPVASRMWHSGKYVLSWKKRWLTVFLTVNACMYQVPVKEHKNTCYTSLMHTPLLLYISSYKIYIIQILLYSIHLEVYELLKSTILINCFDTHHWN